MQRGLSPLRAGADRLKAKQSQDEVVGYVASPKTLPAAPQRSGAGNSRLTCWLPTCNRAQAPGLPRAPPVAARGVGLGRRRLRQEKAGAATADGGRGDTRGTAGRTHL